MAESATRGPRGPVALGLLALCAIGLFALFVSLGVWQIERLAWKRALIAQVDARIHADPVAAPGPAQWDAAQRGEANYLRVSMQGQFQHDAETLVQATTQWGQGFWVLTPLHTQTGMTVLVNRGFVPPDRRDPATRPAPPNPQQVVGLLRQSEPVGAFLRKNDAADDRWFSRDVQAIAQARDLGGQGQPVAPYFVDAQAGAPGEWPVGGLTVVQFKNTHLIYALTWFGLALMVLAATLYVWRYERRLRLGASRSE